MPICYALRHVPFESLGLLEPLLSARGFEIRYVDVPTSELSPVSLASAELVVVLGGPIGAYEDASYPFLSTELGVLEERLLNHKPLIGICLGAQLMARALGSRVYPGQAKEIGWLPLQLSPEGLSHGLSHVSGRRVLHWHGDTFDLPRDARLLASTPLTPNQAFSWGKASIGLQFHLEVTARELEAWYVGHACELSAWRERSVQELRQDAAMFAPLLERPATAALDRILSDILEG